MDLLEKLTILTDAAKYDVACTSSGVDRNGTSGKIGNAAACGICHSFSTDGRCISLLKVLFTNACIYDCKYCLNRRSNDVRRAAFTPRELAQLTIEFYRRNYIEGLFLSSGVFKNPDYTCEQLIETLSLLRNEYQFRGYIHVKGIPGADERLIEQLGLLADRMSVNIELPSGEALQKLAPDKTKQSILKPMSLIHHRIQENAHDIVQYRHAPKFVPAGHSTQMIVGATQDSDLHILRLTQALYRKYELKRVFFSAYIPMQEHALLPSLDTKPPLLREHRLYQADWLLRFYGFDAEEILDDAHPDFNPILDPKCNWAINHLDRFPIEVNRAPYEMLLRVPGIGVKSAKRILIARKSGSLDFPDLKRIGVVLKRAQFFLTCRGKSMPQLKFSPETIIRVLSGQSFPQGISNTAQLSLFASDSPTKEDMQKCLSGQL